MESNGLWRMMPRATHSVQKGRYTQINMEKNSFMTYWWHQTMRKVLTLFFSLIASKLWGALFPWQQGMFLNSTCCDSWCLQAARSAPGAGKRQNIRLLFSICALHEAHEDEKKKVYSFSGMEITQNIQAVGLVTEHLLLPSSEQPCEHNPYSIYVIL